MNHYLQLADAVAVLHGAYVAVVTVGFVLIVIGIAMRWGWVRTFWFRAAHINVDVNRATAARYGLTIEAGYPSWHTLLRELCSATGVVCADPLESKPTETLLTLADSCCQANTQEYCNVLSRCFACTPPNIPDELRYLAKLKFKAYVTCAAF
jgi:hypothetical protein